ncbi:MAG: general secretion pathway protein GspD [Planctomycetia bacterium]
MKTTALTHLGLALIACCLMAAPAMANPGWFAIDAGMTAAFIGQSGYGGGAPQMSPRQQADDLLARARQAMGEGRLNVADQLITQAESLKVRYNPLEILAYTPAKARKELRQKQSQTASPATSAMADPFLNHPALAAMPAQNAGSQVRLLPAVNAATPNRALQGNSPGRSLSDGLLLQARRALAMGDVKRAMERVAEAKLQRVNYGPSDDTPARVEADIRLFTDLVNDKNLKKHTQAYHRKLARVLMQQAEALLAWKDFDTAERLTVQAQGLRADFGPVEKTPAKLLSQIVAARAGKPVLNAGNQRMTLAQAKEKALGLTRRARDAFSAGDLKAAEMYAQNAVALQVPPTAFAPNEDRPGLVMREVQRARESLGGPVMQTSATGTNPVTPAVHHQAPGVAHIAQPANYVADPTRPNPIQQTQAMMPAPAAGRNPAMDLFMRGEAALKTGNTAAALEYYRQAAQLRSQLDPMTAQRVQDKIQLLTQPGSTAGMATEAVPSSIVEEAVAKQQVLARQVYSDVNHQIQRAMQLRETDPQTGLKLLEQSRKRVEEAGLEVSMRNAILRRVDRSISGFKQYIQDNSSRLALNERNDAVRAELQRQQQYELDKQARLKELTDRYNELRVKRKFIEAEAVAKEAIELDPDSTFAAILRGNVLFDNQNRFNIETKRQKQEGWLQAMNNAEIASTPFDDNNPIQFPKDWDQLSLTRKAWAKRQRMMDRSEKELEIEQRLKTPVSVSFHNEPLQKVLHQLADLAQVNLYLDMRAFTEEAISPDTPISINLRDEISLRSALNIILEQYRLCYTIKNDSLTITSDAYNDKDLVTRPYHVADLVIPIPNFAPGPNMGLGGAYNIAMQRCNFGVGGFTGGPPIPAGLAANNTTANGVINQEILAQMPNLPIGGGGATGFGGGGANSVPVGFGPGGLGGGSQADFDGLIELIQATVDPETWSEVGGAGSISQFETNNVLVIRQTQEVHEKIQNLLEQLRRLQDLQVTIEVRFITLNDNFFERIGVDFDFDIDDDIDRPYQVFGKVLDDDGGATGDDDDDDDDGGLEEPQRDTRDQDFDRSVTVGMSLPGVFTADLDIPFRQNSFGLATPAFGGYDATAGASMGFAILSDIEAFFFIEAATGDRRTNVLQAPKVTLFNGQQAFVSDQSQSPFVMSVVPVVGDFAAAQQPVIVILSEGTFLTVQAVVSADRRFVRLTVVPFFSTIGDVDTFTFTGERTTTSDTSTEGSTVVPNDHTRENDIRSDTVLGTTVQLPTFSSVSVTTTVSVPDGGTVLLGGIKRLSEGRSEFGVPMLNQIPYVNRLFKNVGIGRETQSLMMMVTPRIIIQEEEEERIGMPRTSYIPQGLR